MKLDILADYGIDCEKGLARCLGDQALYERLLLLFLEDDSLARAKEAFEERDYSTLYDCMHALKGACGNLEMTELYRVVYSLMTYLRLEHAADGDIIDMLSRMEAAYGRVCEGILLANEA